MWNSMSQLASWHATPARDIRKTVCQWSYRLRLLRRSRGINVFQYFGSAALEQRLANEFAEYNRISSDRLLAQHFRTIGTRDNACEMQLAILHLGKRANRNLTSSAELVQQCPLTNRRSSRVSVIQERKLLAHLDISLPNLDAQRSLSCC